LTPLLSIIIPAHNEENRLPASLEKVLAFLRSQNYSAEIILVENGSSDRTPEIARQAAERNPQVRWIQETLAGKGRAVRSGMLAAKGDYRFICDADLSMPIEEVNRFLPEHAPPYDVAIASREVPGAIRYDEPTYRHWIGRVFNWLVRTITLPGLQDTQCGFKCFRAEVAMDLFPRQTIDGWTFDVEILFLALRRGWRVIEIPIPWYYNPGSRVRIITDSLQMLSDLFLVRWNALHGRYDEG